MVYSQFTKENLKFKQISERSQIIKTFMPVLTDKHNVNKFQFVRTHDGKGEL